MQTLESGLEIRLGEETRRAKFKHIRKNVAVKTNTQNPSRTVSIVLRIQKRKKLNRKDLDTTQTRSLLPDYNYWTNFHGEVLVKKQNVEVFYCAVSHRSFTVLTLYHFHPGSTRHLWWCLCPSLSPVGPLGRPCRY